MYIKKGGQDIINFKNKLGSEKGKSHQSSTLSFLSVISHDYNNWNLNINTISVSTISILERKTPGNKLEDGDETPVG